MKRFHPESLHLPFYDYSRPAAYFVTIVTKNRLKIFGEVKDGVMQLSDFGRVTEACWLDLPDHYGNMHLDVFIIMPNHVHGIIVIDEPSNIATLTYAGHRPTSTAIIGSANHGLPEMVRAFKSYAAMRINLLRGSEGVAVWQRRYYESIIRKDDPGALDRVRQYILNNPMKWQMDELNR